MFENGQKGRKSTGANIVASAPYLWPQGQEKHLWTESEFFTSWKKKSETSEKDFRQQYRARPKHTSAINVKRESGAEALRSIYPNFCKSIYGRVLGVSAGGINSPT